MHIGSEARGLAQRRKDYLQKSLFSKLASLEGFEPTTHCSEVIKCMFCIYRGLKTRYRHLNSGGNQEDSVSGAPFFEKNWAKWREQ
jgi:hypothetical protein